MLTRVRGSTGGILQTGEFRKIHNTATSFTVEDNRDVALHSDGYWYQWLGDTPNTVPAGTAPNEGWVCVGFLDGYEVDSVKNFMGKGVRVVDAFRRAMESKAKRGGGMVKIHAGSYTLEDELVLIDYVQLKGSGRRATLLYGSPTANGENKAVVRASKNPIASQGEPDMLSYSGIRDVTINGNNTFDVGLYVRRCTNESDFDNVTTQNCKKINTSVIASWYIHMDNHVSRDAMGKGATIGLKNFNEQGLDEVNFCSFLNLRSNYSGKNNNYNPDYDKKEGAGVIIWKANTCAFSIVAAENSYGVGVVVRKGINSTIPCVYVEANGRSPSATDKIGLYVISADYTNLVIGSLNLTSEQKVFLDTNTVVSVESLYRHSFETGVFLGSGKVVLRNPQDINNLTEEDLTYVRNINCEQFTGSANIPFWSWTSLDQLAFYTRESRTECKIILVPRKTHTTTDPVIVGVGTKEISFGNEFTQDKPIIRSVDVDKGVVRLRHRSNSLPAQSTAFSADLFIVSMNVDGFPIYKA